MTKVKEAQSLVSAAVDPLMGMLGVRPARAPQQGHQGPDQDPGQGQDGGQDPAANHPIAADVPDPVSVVGVLGRETDTVGRGLETADEKGQNPGIDIGGLALSLVIATGKVKGKRKNLVKKMRSKKKILIRKQSSEPSLLLRKRVARRTAIRRTAKRKIAIKKTVTRIGTVTATIKTGK